MAWIARLTVTPTHAAFQPRPDPEAVIEGLTARLWVLGTTGVAEVVAGESVELLAGFDQRHQAEAAVADLVAANHPGGLALRAIVEPAAPTESWADPSEVYTVDVGRGRSVTVAPGAAFGHGGHPTTRLVLDLLADPILDSLPPARHLLDLGCGTGILTLAALTLGPPGLIATAVDTDPAAVARTTANLAAAGLQDAATVLHGSIEATVGPFDLVLANVLAPVHRLVGSQVTGRCSDAAAVIVSGFLVDQAESVVESYPGFTPALRHTSDDWVGLVLVADEDRARQPVVPSAG